MPTRLRVSGFKNLVDADIRFGAFTCLAGPNGAGKSNLFDAIAFLSALAEEPLVDAALSVRIQKSLSRGDVRQLFRHAGDKYQDEMSFEAEMLVPSEAEDDLGQKAHATTTFLRYSLTLAYRPSELSRLGGLEIRREELVHITRKAALQHLTLPHRKVWRDSVLRGKRSGRAFISTRTDGSAIEVHADKGTGGRNRLYAPQNLPRTVLSSVNALESPTALVARRELQSWRLLQLEPSALRSPDAFSAPPRIGADGSHVAAALARLGLRDAGSVGAARISSLRLATRWVVVHSASPRSDTSSGLPTPRHNSAPSSSRRARPVDGGERGSRTYNAGGVSPG